MNSAMALQQTAGFRDLTRPIVIAIVLLESFVLFGPDSLEGAFSYMLITFFAFLPTVIWIQVGVPGIPVFPVFSLLHFIYYGVAIFRNSTGAEQYEPSEILSVALSVSYFLAAATFVWFLIVRRRMREAPKVDSKPEFGQQSLAMIYLGIGAGIVYNLAIIFGAADWLGTAIGVVRSILLTPATLSCFMLGYLRARNILVGPHWTVAVMMLLVLIILTCSTLFLVGGIMMILSSVLGFVFTARRIPWRTLAVAFAVMFILNAGKSQMREKYWESGSSVIQSPIQIPGVMAEWAGAGIDSLIYGGDNTDLLDRASLVQLFLRAKRITPEFIPFIEGDSYTLLPYMLVPRFISSDRIATQAAQNLLNIQFGLQTEETAAVTAIGWGVIAEAYANFGNVGVVIIGIVIGAFSGFIMRLSHGAPFISARSILAIVAMLVMINLEADFSYLVVNFYQASVSALVFIVVYQRLVGMRSRNTI